MRFVFGECELDVERFQLRRSGRIITIEPKAFQVLAHLLRHGGRAVSKRDLLQRFWPSATDASYLEYCLRNCLYKIRQAIGDAGRQGAVIETIRGFGYRVATPITSLTMDATAAQPETEAVGETDASALDCPRPPSVRRTGRRQLTLLRYELSPALAWADMDPEDFQAFERAFAAACTEIIQRFDGYIAQQESDAGWVYFGYPAADEEAPQRAVWTGMALLEAAQRLDLPVTQLPADAPTIRIGIHTGPVVEGGGPDTSTMPDLSGPAFALAKRAQADAAPGTVVITAQTHELAQGYFTCQPLSEPPSSADRHPVAHYRVLGISGLHTRFEIAATHGLTPFVGREPELALLRHGWQQVQQGVGHMLLLSGEPGIGKSRLVQVLKEQVAAQPHLRWECRSSSYYQETPLYPITEFFHRALQWQANDSQAQKLKKLEQTLRQHQLPIDETINLFASWLSVSTQDTAYPPPSLSAQQQRQLMLDCIVTILLQLAERQPMLFILEDAHWADPTTLDLLELILEQLPAAAIYVVLTCRDTFQPRWSPRACMTQWTLTRLSQRELEAMILHLLHGKALPPEILAHVMHQTDGVPLFVEALLTMILDAGLLREEADRYVLTGPLPLSAIPTTLQDLLMARLDWLLDAKDLIQLASVLGYEFSYEALQAVSCLDDHTLQERLAHAKYLELIHQRGILPKAHYRFTHALIQDAAYHSLLRGARQQMHKRVAEVLEARVSTNNGDPTRTPGASLCLSRLCGAGAAVLASRCATSDRKIGLRRSPRPPLPSA